MRALIPLLTLLLLSCQIGVNYPAVLKDRVAQDEATVWVETVCSGTQWTDPLEVKYGSGVLMGDRRILTANHVVHCPYYGEYHVTTIHGQRYRMLVAEHNEKTDIAYGTLASADHFGINPPLTGTPGIGETVCSSYSVPSWGHSCGVVESIRNDSRIEFTGRVEHGNSGGGVYNERGQLIGVISAINLTNGNGIIATGI